MKNSLLVLVLSSVVLCAQEYIHLDRMKNMQEMETAMANIQKGFLY